MEIQCDAIRIKASLSEQDEPQDNDQQAQQAGNINTSVINNQVAQLEKSLKRYVDKQFQQFTRQKRP
ncbi:hypothetical protein PA25_27700 [Pseudoalteromonas sp. A25]|uniref:hypothetical protein n=1 Tax=Pseudoalteromonas sp. A25 TaxID=116092 RepID=UPI0012608BF8|nr:hypothetical protein [Pseudoalteromonas sp. A25]BBN82785.1 hypothetical protein PA25_27700 [Pseudoalteromonas sp. A25]